MKTNIFFNLLLIISLSFAVLSCSEDNEDDGGTDDFEFAGTWTGTYSGDDTGSFEINIGNNGSISGEGYSNGDSASFSIDGTVDTDGDFSASLGSTSTGAEFNGSINGNSMNGNWFNSSTGDSGSFTGSRTGGGPVGNCDLEDEIAAAQQALNAFMNNQSTATCNSMKDKYLELLNAAESCPHNDQVEAFEQAYQAWANVDCNAF